jgi:sugar phosphate isomerase/epimerase
MQIGVLTALYQQFPLNEVLDKVKAMGVTAVELGTGAYAASAHLGLDHLLEDKAARKLTCSRSASGG